MSNEMKCCCVAPDTEITMADGRMKRIQDVRIGDCVVGRNCKIMRVLNCWIGPERDSMLEIMAQGMESPLFATKTHPILVQESDGTTKWKPAGECKLSDKVFVFSFYEEKGSVITSIKERKPCDRVYNLDLLPLGGIMGKQAGTMYCNGILTGDFQIQNGVEEG